MERAEKVMSWRLQARKAKREDMGMVREWYTLERGPYSSHGKRNR